MNEPITLSHQRRLDALGRALGPAIAAALNDGAVVEALVNADGILRLDTIGRGIVETQVRLTIAEREAAIRILASEAGEIVTRERPFLAATLPGSQSRVQAMVAPLVSAPVLAIRKRPAHVLTLADYVASGIASERQADQLRRAVAERRNIVVSGGTGSGKTTLLNALLAEPDFQAARVLILEDNAELQCGAPDCVALLTKRTPPVVGLRDLVQMSLRLRPDRIIVGEVRDGAALEVLKAWNTGHPGGLLTLHANSAADALARLEDLCGEAAPLPATRLIASSVDLIVHIVRTREGRRIGEILDPRKKGACASEPNPEGAPT